MYILGFDTSTKAISVALGLDDKIIDSISILNNAEQSVDLLPSIKQILDRNNIKNNMLNLISVSAGPGSFTGVRIGISTAKGLAITNKIPISAVSSLESSAYCFSNIESIICPVIDARNSNVYSSLFYSDGNGKITRLTDDNVVEISNLNDIINSAKEYDSLPLYMPGNIQITTLSESNMKRIVQTSIPFSNSSGVVLAGYHAYLNNLINENSYLNVNPIYLGHSRYEINKK